MSATRITNADTRIPELLKKNFIVPELTQQAADVYTSMKDIEQIVHVPVFPRNGELSIEFDEAVRVKMKTQGTKILFESRAPIGKEL